jgi:multidrug efflux pump subunit AcrB
MGVVPMVFGGSGLWSPMGCVICYGALITMFFILTIMPIAYWKVMERSEKNGVKEIKEVTEFK